ncbi:geranylgeranylglycerol-phosphate geranylgeranyltransferase [Flavobacterium sp. SM15]|uniref:geranylgeranylglycerol-phosphate geranylgeranyltransferase n=1 Tax=Flavobacterium sp. SM15 TaxID=2908005 RepID=UPI001EDBCF13|nr:geranylgeranylglycerol-phosphate geranylgeranyltransferase [Flavobacterium sp. SM15]MCG2611967.1 geranylgeranylglycerol-phosphate geranylgeranyltransferase [Flavobacterium sp. SM15]
MKFLKLIRYQNLLMLALMQLVFHFVFFKNQTDIFLALADWQFLLLVLATVTIAAGGYVINNIMDQETDQITKPENQVVGNSISEAAAYNIYAALNIIGVGIGFYLSNLIGKPMFSGVFIGVSATLYMYATNLKQNLLVGNIIVALLLSFSVILVGIFDLYPATYEENRVQMAMLFSILLDYAVFAFIINFIREIVKDIEDMDGDYNAGMSTLPIILGKERTTKLVFGLTFIPIALLLWYLNENLLSLEWVLFYLLLFVLAPLLYFLIKIWSAKSKKEYSHLSLILKLVLLFGILSIVVITVNMKFNA